MPVTRAKTFKSGNSEAVRLPKGFGFGVGTQVRVEREGERVVLTPERADDPRPRLARMIEAMKAVGRPGGPRQERDDIWIDREG